MVELRISGPAGPEVDVEAVLDTGFTEFLTLPPALITSLGLPFQYWMPLALADGTPVQLEVYEATVMWHGQQRTVPVHATAADPLLGMHLLYGSRLLADVVDGGSVTITPLP